MFGLPPLAGLTDEERERLLGTTPRPKKPAPPSEDLSPFWVAVGEALAYVVMVAVVLALLWAVFD